MRGIAMKKYVKPELFFERYELNQHIAACTWDLNLVSEGACGFKADPTQDPNLSPEWVLMTNVQNCNFEGEVCYMNSTSDFYNTFNS